MSTSSGFLVHTMKQYATALYTTEAQALATTHAYKFTAITTVVYGRNVENEPVLRIRMADYRVLVSMGNEAITPNSFRSDHDTEPMSLSRSCATSRLEPWTDTRTEQLQRAEG